MNTFNLKLIAIGTMVVDHVGLFFFPEIIAFRIIGRLAFPLFAWLIANGAYRTRDINKYALRLFIFALISQIPYVLPHKIDNPDYFGLNIFFTLFIGLVCIMFLKKYEYNIFSVAVVGLIVLISGVLDVSYGMAGILSIIAFYVFFKDFPKMVAAQVLIFFGFYLYPATISGYFSTASLVQPLAIASLVFINMFNGKEGHSLKYFFYTFYPLHFLVIYLIMLIRG
jgi:hypothetical protein